MSMTIQFTANQLILLLQIYRGTLADELKIGTYEGDKATLTNAGFIRVDSQRNDIVMTAVGSIYVTEKILGK